MGNKGKLFLIPSAIAASSNDLTVPPAVRAQLADIRDFVVEDVRTARRSLSSLKIYESMEAVSFSVLDKDTAEAELGGLLAPIFQGRDVGVLSEAGCPGVADPGAQAVAFAHANGVKVVPLVGPSSILLALMASGLNGQRFAFHGYLPIQAKEAAKAIGEYERESRTRNQTQIFIETPYRNGSLLDNLLNRLSPDTRLCIALDITGPNEFIAMKPVKDWRQNKPAMPKEPAVFLFLA